jgi:HPt (histidine-containing phosphotransfer) domain-containing protein
MPESSPPEFDWSQAESLLGEDPQNVPPEIAEIVVELEQSAKERFAELKTLDPAASRVVIGGVAHQLRGSLLNFGFVAVGAILLDIEKKEYPAADYPGLVAKAEKVFYDSMKLLASRYPTLPSS